jgi:hypothetical protein
MRKTLGDRDGWKHERHRAGQHHALEMGLMMLDRARWTGKLEEAEIYRRWLAHKLSRPLTNNVVSLAAKREEKEEKPVEAVSQNELKLAA